MTVATPAIGNLRIFSVAIDSTPTVTGVSGGGVGTWNQATTNTANSQWMGLYWGAVTSTSVAPTTITVTYSGTVTLIYIELLSQLFVSDLTNPQWLLNAAGNTNSASGTTITWPTLTPTIGTGVYFGSTFVDNTGSAGSTSGFTNGVTTGADNPYCYDTSVTAAVTPTASASPAGWWDAVALLIGVQDLSQFFQFF